MNELREKVRDVVYEAMDYADSREPRIPGQWDSVEDTATDRILALIAEAMLSEEAVKAAARALYDTEAPFCDQQGNPQSYEQALSPIGQFNYLKRTRKILAAAAGVTGAGQEGTSDE